MIALFRITREEPAWSAEALNACWTSGRKRPEATGATEETLEEKKAEPDHLADSEDGGRDQRFLHKNSDERSATSAGQKTQRRGGVGDQIRSQVTKLLKQRRDENEEAHRRRSATAKAGNPEQKRKTNDKLTEKRGDSRSAFAWPKKRGTGVAGSGSQASSFMMR